MNDDNESQKTAINRTSRLSARLKIPEKRAIIIAVLILATVGAVSYLAYKKYGNQPVVPSVPAFSYDEENQNDILFANHLLKGVGQNSGMAFKLPLNGIVYPDSPFEGIDERLVPESRDDVLIREGNSTELGLRHVEGGRLVLFQSLIAAYILPDEQQPNLDYVNYFGARLSSLVFINGGDAKNVVLGLKPPVQFANENIAKGAQLFEFTAYPTTKVDEEHPIDKVTGYIIEVSGKNTKYYLLIGAMQDVWMSGSETWQTILNSIKVDQ